MAGVTTTGHSGPVDATEGDYYIPQSYYNAETTAAGAALAGHTNTYNRTAAPGELTLNMPGSAGDSIKLKTTFVAPNGEALPLNIATIAKGPVGTGTFQNKIFTITCTPGRRAELAALLAPGRSVPTQAPGTDGANLNFDVSGTMRDSSLPHGSHMKDLRVGAGGVEYSLCVCSMVADSTNANVLYVNPDMMFDVSNLSVEVLSTNTPNATGGFAIQPLPVMEHSIIVTIDDVASEYALGTRNADGVTIMNLDPATNGGFYDGPSVYDDRELLVPVDDQTARIKITGSWAVTIETAPIAFISKSDGAALIVSSVRPALGEPGKAVEARILRSVDGAYHAITEWQALNAGGALVALSNGADALIAGGRDPSKHGLAYLNSNDADSPNTETFVAQWNSTTQVFSMTKVTDEDDTTANAAPDAGNHALMPHLNYGAFNNGTYHAEIRYQGGSATSVSHGGVTIDNAAYYEAQTIPIAASHTVTQLEDSIDRTKMVKYYDIFGDYNLNMVMARHRIVGIEKGVTSDGKGSVDVVCTNPYDAALRVRGLLRHASRFDVEESAARAEASARITGSDALDGVSGGTSGLDDAIADAIALAYFGAPGGVNQDHALRGLINESAVTRDLQLVAEGGVKEADANYQAQAAIAHDGSPEFIGGSSILQNFHSAVAICGGTGPDGDFNRKVLAGDASVSEDTTGAGGGYGYFFQGGGDDYASVTAAGGNNAHGIFKPQTSDHDGASWCHDLLRHTFLATQDVRRDDADANLEYRKDLNTHRLRNFNQYRSFLSATLIGKEATATLAGNVLTVIFADNAAFQAAATSIWGADAEAVVLESQQQTKQMEITQRLRLNGSNRLNNVVYDLAPRSVTATFNGQYAQASTTQIILTAPTADDLVALNGLVVSDVNHLFVGLEDDEAKSPDNEHTMVPSTTRQRDLDIAGEYNMTMLCNAEYTADTAGSHGYTIQEERDDTSVRYALRLAEGDRICICMNITVTGAHPQLGGSAIVGLRFRNCYGTTHMVERRHPNAGTGESYALPRTPGDQSDQDDSDIAALQQYYNGMTSYAMRCCAEYGSAEDYSDLVSPVYYNLINEDGGDPNRFVKYWRGIQEEQEQAAAGGGAGGGGGVNLSNLTISTSQKSLASDSPAELVLLITPTELAAVQAAGSATFTITANGPSYSGWTFNGVLERFELVGANAQEAADHFHAAKNSGFTATVVQE